MVLVVGSCRWRSQRHFWVFSAGDLAMHIDLIIGHTKDEDLAHMAKKAPSRTSLQKNASGGVHHVCIEVDDIHAAIKVLQAKGVRVIDQEPKIGAHGKLVVFLHPKSLNGVLVELEQK